MIRRLASVAALLLTVLPAVATEIGLPGSARQLANRVSAYDSYDLPTAGFDGTSVPSRTFEGRVERQTWRIDGAAYTTLQLLAPLREQVEAAGYDVVFTCQDRTCGGFDFRFETEVVPAPDMHVDIRNFRFLSAVRDQTEALSLLVSRSRTAAYVQIIQTTPVDRAPLDVGAQDAGTPDPVIAEEPASGALGTALIDRGHVVLSGLDFETGADRLGEGPHAMLEQLSEFLTDNPTYRIALVGHTDSVGSLDNNVSLSRRRAESVRTRMIERFGVTPARIEAGGMGYLSPVTSNRTPEGREANRRVEVVLLSDR